MVSLKDRDQEHTKMPSSKADTGQRYTHTILRGSLPHTSAAVISAAPQPLAKGREAEGGTRGRGSWKGGEGRWLPAPVGEREEVGGHGDPSFLHSIHQQCSSA